MADGPPSDPSGIVTGEATWRWIPLTNECTWAVDDHGHLIGPPRAGAATTTHRFGGDLGSWFMTGLAIFAIAGFATAWTPSARKRIAAEPT